MKVLVATEKPFAAVAVNGIRQVIENAGYELELLEKYASKQDFLNAVANADGLSSAATRLMRKCSMLPKTLKWLFVPEQAMTT